MYIYFLYIYNFTFNIYMYLLWNPICYFNCIILHYSIYDTIINSFVVFENIIIVIRYVNFWICIVSLHIFCMIPTLWNCLMSSSRSFTVWKCNFHHLIGLFYTSLIISLFQKIIQCFLPNSFKFHLSFIKFSFFV